MNHTKILFVAFVVILLGACTSTREKMDSWLNHHESELIQSWGPPQAERSDGKGGRVLIYSHYRAMGRTQGYGQISPDGSYTYTPPRQKGYTQVRMFFVDERGVIYRWRTENR